MAGTTAEDDMRAGATLLCHDLAGDGYEGTAAVHAVCRPRRLHRQRRQKMQPAGQRSVDGAVGPAYFAAVPGPSSGLLQTARSSGRWCGPG